MFFNLHRLSDGRRSAGLPVVQFVDFLFRDVMLRLCFCFVVIFLKLFASVDVLKEKDRNVIFDGKLKFKVNTYFMKSWLYNEMFKQLTTLLHTAKAHGKLCLDLKGRSETAPTGTCYRSS